MWLHWVPTVCLKLPILWSNAYISNSRYWQEQIDAGKFSQSVLLDNTYGFGGDGAARGNCITTGPFKNYTNSLGPGYEITNHCIDRRINNQMSSGSSQANVDRCLQATSFATAWNCIEGQPHGGGHGGVGGQVCIFYHSDLICPANAIYQDAQRCLQPRRPALLSPPYLA